MCETGVERLMRHIKSVKNKYEGKQDKAFNRWYKKEIDSEKYLREHGGAVKHEQMLYEAYLLGKKQKN